MPLKKCSEGGKSGYKWGDAGKCYTGPDGKKRAIKQGLAIEKPEKFKKIMKSHAEVTEAEVLGAIVEYQFEEQIEMEKLERTTAYIPQSERDKISLSDFGYPEKRLYPADTEEHFKSATKLIGHAPADKREQIKKNLIRIAKRKGYKIPESWQGESKADQLVPQTYRGVEEPGGTQETNSQVGLDSFQDASD